MIELAPGALAGATIAAALAGGALIGLAAALLLAINGRILGVCGIVNGVLDRAAQPGHAGAPGDVDWRIALIAGLVVGAGVVAWASGAAAPRAGFPAWALALAGLLVGAGTRIGNGCTSGHGICGLARASARSLVATVTFIAVGGATVFALRHLLGVLA